MRTFGRSRRSTRATPTSVPPVPYPVTNQSSRCAGEIAEDLSGSRRLVNVGVRLGLELPGEEPSVGLRQLDRLLYMPYPFSALGVRTTFAPRIRINLRLSTEKLSAIVTTSG